MSGAVRAVRRVAFGILVAAGVMVVGGLLILAVFANRGGGG